MLKNLLEKILNKFGKDYTPDSNIPNKLIIKLFVKRFIMLLRGFCKIRKKVFIGRKVKVSNKKNISFGNGCTLDDYVNLDTYSNSKVVFGHNVKLGAYTTVSITSHLSKYGTGLKIGDYSSIGEYSYLGCAGGVEIGDNVIMGQYISFHSENHNFDDKTRLIREQGVTSQGIKLGNNIWVGAKVTFLDGCYVGDNSVVAAGAVVRGEFPPNSIIGGVPAKILKTI